jgi:hypothetical protein
MKLPLIKDLQALVKNVKSHIFEECRAFDEDDIPGMQLTVGWDQDSGEWDYQTGDNSYSGAAYHYPTWGVVGVYRRSNALEVARDIRQQLAEGAIW